MITCQQADVLAAALSVGSIDSGDQAALLQHLGGCAQCRRMAGEYMAAAARLPLALEPVQPSPELRGRLMRAVYAEDAEARRRSAGRRRATWWGRLWEALPTARGFTVAAAAAVVAAAGLAWWGASNRLHNAPASVTVALVANTAMPQAHGELVYDHGTNEAVFSATGLPNPSAVFSGRSVYEVWLIRRDGSAVAAAYLSKDPDGTWRAAVHGDLSRYTAVAATAEPAGGSPKPTGVQVMQGSLSAV